MSKGRRIKRDSSRYRWAVMPESGIAKFTSPIKATLNGQIGSRGVRENKMLHYTIVFFVIALIAAVLGFGGISGLAATIAQVCFLIFLVMAILSMFAKRRVL